MKASVFSFARRARAAVCGVALVCAGVAAAETLGDARQLSRLGEPLRLAIPVRSDGGLPLNERCLSVASSRESDGLPHILTANVAVERDAGGSTVLVTTASPLRDPVSRLVIRTNCEGASRQYTLFLEPAGSTRQVRAVAQPGPVVPAAQSAGSTGGLATKAPTEASDSRTSSPSASAAPVVTVIPVVPAARPSPPKIAQSPPKDAIPPVSLPGARADATISQSDAALPAGSPPTTPQAPATAALAAENENLKQQLAQLNDELQRLQQPPAPARVVPRSLAMTSDSRVGAAAPTSGWEVAWPVLVALAGLAALTAGGFMWRRRHNAADEWALTGPPSHRVVSRTSLAEEPVTFRQAGVRADAPTEESLPNSVMAVPAMEATAHTPPASLRLQPSTEDLARDLEQELFIAEHAHSALERAHPDIVDALTRSWGTAAARQLMANLLQAGSAELARMSGDAVAELRLLLRIADDANPRPDPEPYPPSTLSPPAPAW